MSSQEFRQWQAYSMLEPFGPLREASYFAMLITILLNVFRGKGQGLIKAEDVIPELGEPYSGQEAEAIDPMATLQYFEMINAALGGKGNLPEHIEPLTDPEGTPWEEVIRAKQEAGWLP